MDIQKRGSSSNLAARPMELEPPPATRHFSQAQQSRKNSSRPWRCANRGSSGARQTFVVKVKFRFSPEKKWRNCLWIWVHQSSRFETKVLHKKNRKFYDLHPSSPILNVFICIGFSENRVYPKTWWLIMISEHSNDHELSLCPHFPTHPHIIWWKLEESYAILPLCR